MQQQLMNKNHESEEENKKGYNMICMEEKEGKLCNSIAISKIKEITTISITNSKLAYIIREDSDSKQQQLNPSSSP